MWLTDGHLFLCFTFFVIVWGRRFRYRARALPQFVFLGQRSKLSTASAASHMPSLIKYRHDDNMREREKQYVLKCCEWRRCPANCNETTCGSLVPRGGVRTERNRDFRDAERKNNVGNKITERLTTCPLDLHPSSRREEEFLLWKNPPQKRIIVLIESPKTSNRLFFLTNEKKDAGPSRTSTRENLLLGTTLTGFAFVESVWMRHDGIPLSRPHQEKPPNPFNQENHPTKGKISENSCGFPRHGFFQNKDAVCFVDTFERGLPDRMLQYSFPLSLSLLRPEKKNNLGEGSPPKRVCSKKSQESIRHPSSPVLRWTLSHFPPSRTNTMN